jgi:hypothetical protein
VIHDVPVPSDVAATGALVTDAAHRITVRRVGDVEHKVVGALHRGLRANRGARGEPRGLERGEIVPPSLAAGIVRYAGTST